MDKIYKSLKLKYVSVLVCSALLALVLFIGLSAVGDQLLDYWLQSSDYVQTTLDEKADELQLYVTENDIAASDRVKLNQWTKNQKSIYLQIFANDRITYDSVDADAENVNVASEEDVWQYYNITFSDGNADVYILGMFDLRFYLIEMVINAVLSIVLFLAIFLWNVQKEINYIRCLEKEVKILETGGLDKEITIQGNDELSSLASGINQMKESLKNNMEVEQQLRSSNDQLVTGLSHDLRTPLTTLILYLEFLEGEKYKTDEDRKKYQQKALVKANQIKVLSDQLFERFLITEKQDIELETPQYVQYVFEDLLSDCIVALESQGYQVCCNVEWKMVKISINSCYLVRIMNNISFNFFKYADKRRNICMDICYTDVSVVLKFTNYKSEVRNQMESTGVGIPNIEAMIGKMNGCCHISETGERYNMELEVPLIRDEVYEQQ